MNSQQRLQRQLEEVLKMPGNDRCADCRAASPRWASVNLGIFLCVTCASIHRKMGTHRSRVKSVTLDEWTREQVAAMKEMGNIKSNAIYNPDPKRHPPPPTVADERDSEIQKFIRRKYEIGAFKAGAHRDLAKASVNSRTQGLAARGVHTTYSNGAVSPGSPPDTDRDLPALPSNSRSGSRPRPSNNNTNPWAGLGKTNTGSTTSSSSSNSLAPPVTPAALPPRSASHSSPNIAPALKLEKDKDLLVDVDGSTSSTRPLQLNMNGFPTIPAAPQVLPLPSPGAVTSPLALGQQAFFQPQPTSPTPTSSSLNPFGMQPAPTGYGQTLSPNMQGMYMSNGMGGVSSMSTGMSNGGMGHQLGMMNGGGVSMGGISPTNSMNGLSMSMGVNGMGGGMQQGMMMQPTGMGMNGGAMGMAGVQMAQPVQYQQQQFGQWGYM